MKLQYFILSLLIIVSLVSCAGDGSCESIIPEIEIGKAFENKSNVGLSEYASAIDYIPLETTPGCMLEGADNLLIRSFEDRIYLYSSKSALQMTKTLPLYFKSNGDFVSSIGSFGNSNNEFTNIQTIMIDQSVSQLIVVDYNRFVYYTLDGDFIRFAEVKSNSLTFNGYCSGDNNCIYLRNPSLLDESQGADLLVKVDSMGRVITRTSFPRAVLDQPGTPMGTIKVTKGASLFSSSGNLYLYTHNDSLYRVNPLDLSLDAEFFLDFGKYATNERVGATLWSRDNLFFITEEFVALTALFTYGSFPDIDRRYTRSNFIYDRKNGTTKALKYNDTYGFAGFTNDLDSGMPFYPTYMNDGKMYQLVDAVDFIEFAQMGNSARMKEVASKLTDDSNPVLVVVSLK